MNKLIKSAMMMASVGAMLCVVGCGGGNGCSSPEAAFNAYKNAMISGDVVAMLKSAVIPDLTLEEWNKHTPEEQKEAAKKLNEGLKEAAEAFKILEFASCEMTSDTEAKITMKAKTPLGVIEQDQKLKAKKFADGWKILAE